jgi:hypothetical protein
MQNIFKVLDLMDAAGLNANQTLLLHTVIVRLNRNFWKPVSITGEKAGRGMSKNTFLKVRKSLCEDGWIVKRDGQWKTALPVYDLGPRFNINDNAKTENEMRSRENIRELVVAIDKDYPDFSGFCARYKWDKAIELFKAEHPELTMAEWPVDSIGDPANREQAHGMMVELHRRKKKKPAEKVDRQATLPEAWSPFYLFVDMWRLSYPKKGNRASIITAVKDLIKGKEEWAPEQVKALQDIITSHTAAYVASFSGDYTYMVSPVNYFAAEKWTEKVSVKQPKRDKTDVHQKMAGAHAVPNMPKITTIKVN